MTDVASLYDKIEQNVRALADVRSLRIKVPDSDSTSAVGESGFVSVLPLWHERGATIGLLAWPGRPPDQWRGVIVDAGQIMTLSANPKLIIPRFLFMRFISNEGSALRQLADDWNRISDRVERLHAALGGEAPSLAPVQRVIENPGLHGAFSLDPARPERFAESMSALAREIDPSPSFALLADWVDAAVSGTILPLPRPDELGVWDRLCLCWAKQLLSYRMPPLPEHCTNDVIECSPGLDACAPGLATWAIRPGGSSGEAVLIALAKQASQSDLRGSASFERIVAALVEQTFGYDGGAHADAVAIYDEAGEPERAWDALTAAAWWMAKSLGGPVPAIRKGVHLLCERHGWDDVQWVVDRTMGAAS